MSITPESSPIATPLDIGETRAKGARNVGLIWMLVASPLGAILAVAIIWTVFSVRFHGVDRAGQSTVRPAEAAQSHTPPATVPNP